MSIVLYFQVHQPYRLCDYRVFDIGSGKAYFDEERNRREVRRIANRCYLPANAILLDLLRTHPQFSVSFSISGTALEQFEEYAPEVLHSFQELVETGRVELLSESYHHSLAFVHDREEFWEQVALHREAVERHFQITPRVLRNTELVFHNDLAREAEARGYQGVLCEGADRLLTGRPSGNVYRAQGAQIPLLLKNYRLSDDIAFRFSDQSWSHYPLSAERYVAWIEESLRTAHLVNLFLDYETLGEHQDASSGIHQFLSSFPSLALARGVRFLTCSQALARHEPEDRIDASSYTSWADEARDLSAWLGNQIQQTSAQSAYALRPRVLAAGDPRILADWRRLLTSDHFYYMCTKWFADGDVHKYFNPHETPYDAFISYMNAIEDVRMRIEGHIPPAQVPES